MEFKSCTLCGASWIGGQHFWKTGRPGNELDLAGLVCNNIHEEDIPRCVNPLRGSKGGDSWERRNGFIEGAMFEYSRLNDKKDEES